MKKFLKRLMLLILLGALVYGAYYVYGNTEILRIQEIEYNLNDNIDLYEIQRYSKVELGTSYFMVKPREVKTQLETHPYIESVKVEKKFPHTLKLDIVYREHYFNIVYSDIILSLDDSLHVLKVLDEPMDGYTVEGFAFDSFSTGQTIIVQKKYLLENIVLLIQLLKKSHIEEIPIISYEHDGIMLRFGELKVRFGNGSEIESKFNDFINIYEALKSEDIITGTIDVSSAGLPVYRPFGE